MEEQLKCNICNVMIYASQADQHISTLSHTTSKSRLEQDLNAVKEECYKNDRSVVILWEKSI